MGGTVGGPKKMVMHESENKEKRKGTSGLHVTSWQPCWLNFCKRVSLSSFVSGSILSVR